MKDNQVILRVDSLSKQFRLHMQKDKKINGCENISFSLKQGEFMGIAGPSGAGKSTIIKCIYRTYLSTSGNILYQTAGGKSVNLASAPEKEIIRLRRQEISYVSQFLRVIPRITAIDVLAEGLRQRDWELEQARDRARYFLSMMNIDPALWDAYPSTFSGGEQQRINLAKALVWKPRLLLLDEPTASLDMETKNVVVQALMALKKEGTTIIGIFHDNDVMQRLADRIFTMKAGSCKSNTLMQEVV